MAPQCPSDTYTNVSAEISDGMSTIGYPPGWYCEYHIAPLSVPKAIVLFITRFTNGDEQSLDTVMNVLMCAYSLFVDISVSWQFNISNCNSTVSCESERAFPCLCI